MNETKEKLITRMVDCKIQNIRNNSMEEEWIADVLNFGWNGYDKYSNEELLEEAQYLLEMEDLPTLEELT